MCNNISTVLEKVCFCLIFFVLLVCACVFIFLVELLVNCWVCRTFSLTYARTHAHRHRHVYLISSFFVYRNCGTTEEHKENLLSVRHFYRLATVRWQFYFRICISLFLSRLSKSVACMCSCVCIVFCVAMDCVEFLHIGALVCVCVCLTVFVECMWNDDV